ncbi:MAG TPA: iron-containing redox enzyme family protein [Marmoricola sp.]|nr:iron-containing redox enzyme family protein [Marmoricola sp.]
MLLPEPTGALSAQVIDALRAPATTGSFPSGPSSYDGDCLHDADFQLALWVLYELHYRGFDDCDEEWEWHPGAFACRAVLERVFVDALRAAGPVPETSPDAPLHERIEALVEAVPGADLARFMQREATLEQYREYLKIKSVYHLKESDPQSFVLARLRGVPKVRLAELQYDEYGSGRPDRLHQTLFARTLVEAGLDDTYGVYLQHAPATTLAVNNATSLFALHRRFRGAAMGHLAAFESTSSIPCRRIAQGMRRIGLSERAAEYFDEHVEADAVHEQLALRDICGVLGDDEPELVADILFGAFVCCHLEALDGAGLVTAWREGRSALRDAADLVGAA